MNSVRLFALQFRLYLDRHECQSTMTASEAGHVTAKLSDTDADALMSLLARRHVIGRQCGAGAEEVFIHLLY